MVGVFESVRSIPLRLVQICVFGGNVKAKAAFCVENPSIVYALRFGFFRSVRLG
jgi:hypothetical protein